MDPVVQDHLHSMGDHGKRIGQCCRRGALAGLFAMLAGCVPEQPPPAPAAVAAVQPAPRPVIVHRRPPAPPKRKPEQASREEAAPPTEAQPEAPAATQPVSAVPSATELVGLDEQRATELLGPATATDTRSPATVWHYKSSRCQLDLAFYMEMRSGRMRTLHYNFKGGADNAEQRQACLKAIIEENRKGERS